MKKVNNCRLLNQGNRMQHMARNILLHDITSLVQVIVEDFNFQFLATHAKTQLVYLLLQYLFVPIKEIDKVKYKRAFSPIISKALIEKRFSLLWKIRIMIVQSAAML
jgi:hypothetical protein